MNGGKSPALYANAYTDFDFWMTNEGDEDIPINEAKIKECTKPKTTWSNALSGIMILPGVTSIFIDQESPIITKEVADLFAKKTITADPNAPYFKNIPRPKTFQTNKTGVLWLYVRGCIDYFDQFRNPYRTSLCQIYEPSEHTPSGVFSPCRKGGNEAD